MPSSYIAKRRGIPSFIIALALVSATTVGVMFLGDVLVGTRRSLASFSTPPPPFVEDTATTPQILPLAKSEDEDRAAPFSPPADDEHRNSSVDAHCGNSSSTSVTSNVHVHIHSIGDSLAAGMFRNLLQSKMFRTMSRFFPFAPNVASGLAMLNATYRRGGSSKVVSYSSNIFAYPGSRTDEILEKFVNWSDTAKSQYRDSMRNNRRKGAEKSALGPIVQAVWDVLLHRLPPGVNVSLLRDVMPPLSPSAMRPRAPQISVNSRGAKKLVHFGPPPPAPQLLDHLVIVCIVLAGTNDALHAPGRFPNLTLPDDVEPQVSLRNIMRMQARCRDDVVDAVQVYDELLRAARRGGGANKGRSRKSQFSAHKSWQRDVRIVSVPKHVLLNGSIVPNGGLHESPLQEEGDDDELLVLPGPRVTVLNVPVILPPMLIRNDSTIMRDLLIPRRNREDSNRLFGRLCFMWNNTAKAVLASHAFLNSHLADTNALAKFLSISEKENGGPGVRRRRRNAEKSRACPRRGDDDDGSAPFLNLRVSSRAIDVADVLLAEAPGSVKLTQGGFYSDCIHPSLAGYQEVVKSILQQLDGELRLFL
jgi:hypothetical protein